MLLPLALGFTALLHAASPDRAAEATWTSLGPHGYSWVSVAALSFDSGAEHLYAATNHGVFRKARHEQEWSTGSVGMTHPAVTSMALDLNLATIYVGTTGTQRRGAFRSDDAGATWEAIEPNGAVIALATDPSLSSTVLAIAHFYPIFPHIGPLYGGIFKSSNRGASWREVYPFSMSGWVATLAVDPRLPETVYAGASGAGIFKSTDAGETWNPARSGFDGDSVHALIVDPFQGVILAGTDRGLIRSGDGAGHWVRSSLGLPDRAVLSFAIDPFGQTIYAGTNGAGLFRSEDGGLRWVEEQPALRNLAIVSLAVDPVEGILYAGTQRFGVFGKLIDREPLAARSPRRLPLRGE